MQSAGHTILKTTQLGLRRSERWLFQNLSFSLSTGQVIQVTGENGSGKTSLLRCVCGLLPQQTGEVDWQIEAEEPIIPLFFGHSPSIKTELTVMENLLYHPVNGRFYDEPEIEQALYEVGLGNYLDRMARHLSAGQTRRVGLARLLFADSKCWILDEPFTALDVKACQWLEGVISRFAQQGGAVLITSHQPMQLDVPVSELRIEEDMSHV
jgi:heme exporter protein A